MDNDLKSRIGAQGAGDAPADDRVVRLADAASGRIELVTPGQPDEHYTLRPLRDLYGTGTGLDSVEMADDTFLPLLMSIEEMFVEADAANPRLSDGAVLAALDRLCLSPDGDVGNDALAREVQFSLRLTLSLNNYSRSDVRRCLRKVKQSVARHTSLAGPHGYLTFIRQQLRR